MRGQPIRTLLVLRHAKSDWGQPELSDHDRPLNPRGRKAARRMGQLLRAEGLIPDRIITSTARRAHQTAERVAEASGYRGAVEPAPALYLAGPEAYLEILRTLPDSSRSALVVGHNPGVEHLLTTLTGQQVAMPTAALARVALPIDRWRDLTAATCGELIQVWRPRELP